PYGRCSSGLEVATCGVGLQIAKLCVLCWRSIPRGAAFHADPTLVIPAESGKTLPVEPSRSAILHEAIAPRFGLDTVWSILRRHALCRSGWHIDAGHWRVPQLHLLRQCS